MPDREVAVMERYRARITLDGCPRCGRLTFERSQRSHECVPHQHTDTEKVEYVRADQLQGAVEALRTLRAYLIEREGEGPVRYSEALALCESFLPEHQRGR